MIIERHYDDEALSALLESGRVDADAHLPSCTACTEKLESFRMIADALHHQDVWDTRELRLDPVPATIANLRAFADRMTLEDAQADAILPELLAGPREEWMPRLQEHPEWHTAGVVRRLIAAAARAVDTMPPDAVEITALATEIADHLDPGDHPSDTVTRLRGAAWRERGYALYYTGDFAKSERAVERADGEFAECLVSEYDQARTGIVRALVFRAFERFHDAGMAASFGAETFSRFGDVRKTVSARMAEVHLLVSRSEYGRAVTVLEALERQIRQSEDSDLHARVLSNLGYATWKVGWRAVAMQRYESASVIFDALGTPTEAARNRWNVAAILAEDGRLGDAKHRFREVIREFTMLSMSSESAIASLDLAELLLAVGEFEEVEQLCHSAMRSFERAGVAYTRRAITAIAYIRDAAQQRRANQKLVRHVRDYIRRLPSEPLLLFTSPPS